MLWYSRTDIDTVDIYVEIATAFPTYKSHLKQFWQLLKALYGSKQAAMLWFSLVVSLFKQLGYVQEVSDCFAFNYFNSSGS